MILSWDPDVSPRRSASEVSGSDSSTQDVSSALRASPTPVPVVSAIHDAADRCPSSRHLVDWAARLENSTFPAEQSRSTWANIITRSTACHIATGVGITDEGTLTDALRITEVPRLIP